MKPIYTIVPGAGDLPMLHLAAPDGARADIYLYGAHVVSWIPAGDDDCLFLSRASQFRCGEPIRGGIPVIFPQFGLSGPLPLHGLVRLMTWEFAGVEYLGNQASAVFRLRDTEESLNLWPHAFLAELSVMIGGSQMDVKLGVTNTGDGSFKFTTSFHTYLRVSDIKKTFVQGLAGLRYRDAAAGGVEKLETSTQVEFTGEVSRIYFDAPAEARLVEPVRTIIARQAGFSDTVVWNPAAEKCASMPDLEPDDYQRFVCIEAATVGKPVELAPGERWEGSQVLEA
jgi:glucose-6-phosphate 1-epimerase